MVTQPELSRDERRQIVRRRSHGAVGAHPVLLLTVANLERRRVRQTPPSTN